MSKERPIRFVPAKGAFTMADEDVVNCMSRLPEHRPPSEPKKGKKRKGRKEKR